MVESPQKFSISQKLEPAPNPKAGVEPAFRLWEAKLKKKIIWGTKTTNFLKNRGKNYFF
jgi:hypothetical protein